MDFIKLVFFSIGFSGLLLAIFWPFVFKVICFSNLNQKKADSKNNLGPSSAQSTTLDILIPVYNDQKNIGSTLQSVWKELIDKNYKVIFYVALDSCTDNSKKEIIKKKNELHLDLVIIETKNKNKWLNLKTLISASSARWVALVDSGTLWSKGLLNEINLNTDQDNNIVLGFSPSYSSSNRGLGALLWKLERVLKSAENAFGGPISVHGATVFYSTKHLNQALAQLNKKANIWINDDLAIPLMLKTLYPSGSIKYFDKPGLTAWLEDPGQKDDLPIEKARRRRMSDGNIQWIKLLLWDLIKAKGWASVIVWRRVFRFFWAYFVSFIIIGLSTIAYLSTVILLAFYQYGPLQKPSILKKISNVFFASLEFPFRVYKSGVETKWN